MAGNYLRGDVHGLRVLAVLMEGFWRGQMELAAEIRLQAGLFGLDPLSRRKLGWSVTREETREGPRTPSESEQGGRRDPRAFLQMVGRTQDPLRSLRSPDSEGA